MFWQFGKKKKQQTDFVRLKEKWEIKHASLQDRLYTKHKEALDWFITTPKNIALTSLASFVMFISPGLPVGQLATESAQVYSIPDRKAFLQSDLFKVLPVDPHSITTDQEKQISEVLSRYLAIKVTPELHGLRLNTTYGYIGQEQHLARFPGDGITTHFDTTDEANTYANKGMAPGLGAWGYFASSQGGMTQEDNLREKYYIAVQTFLAPGYSDNVEKYNDFFKYRKMLVVNPNNGKAIVVDIADSGPSEFTGKQLGGSPEVMHYLDRVDGAQKGLVLYYFIDDPENKVPLGPISL